MIDIKELALEYERTGDIENGYALGDCSEFVKWINDFSIPCIVANLYIEGMEPVAHSYLTGADFGMCWYQLEDGTIIGIYDDADKNDAECGGHEIPPTEIDMPRVKNYRLI